MENLGKIIDHLVYLRPLEIFYGHLVYFVVIWYIFPVLVFCTKINLATLPQTTQSFDRASEPSSLNENLSRRPFLTSPLGLQRVKFVA
jgi:hypothetical protein